MSNSSGAMKRWTFHFTLWTLEQLLRSGFSGKWKKQTVIYGGKNPGHQTWEAPLNCVCFVYFTAHLITPAVNICPNASSQVCTTLKVFFPRVNVELFWKVWVNSSTRGPSFDHHTHWYGHVFADHIWNTLSLTWTPNHTHIYTHASKPPGKSS